MFLRKMRMGQGRRFRRSLRSLGMTAIPGDDGGPKIVIARLIGPKGHISCRDLLPGPILDMPNLSFPFAPISHLDSPLERGARRAGCVTQ